MCVSLIQNKIIAQPITYSIKKAYFSSDTYDEFSPVFYKNGIVYCTNRNPNLLFNYSSSQDKGLFKMYYADTAGIDELKVSTLFSKVLTTNFNDGPATFNSKGDTIYFSRNLEVDGKLKNASGSKNRLGLFYSVLTNGKWTKVKDVRINNEWYNVTTPYLSPDGKRIYFASDKPGGYGGSDLYYCQWQKDYWNDPVNLGPVINTNGNESYPFINRDGELFFSSDGHPGLGGKDIFFSRLKDDNWFSPVRLDPPVNSKFDDFGIVTDPLINRGYFSSNRDKSIDIYQFVTIFPQSFYNEIQRENKYCFKFSDSSILLIDTLILKYRWDFGDGKQASGIKVNHCFPGAGKYNVKLDIVDRATGKLYFSKLSYRLDLLDFDQPYINSKDIVIKGDEIDFDGLKSHLQGFKILSYSWNFGDGTKANGDKVKHTFREKGEFLVNLELTLKPESGSNTRRTGISKRVIVLNDIQERTKVLASNSFSKSEFTDITRYSNASVTTIYAAEADLKKDPVFQVVLIASKTKIGLNSYFFRDVSTKYLVKETFNPDDNTYRYIIDQQLSLMACYPTFREMIRKGFKDVYIKSFLLLDPAEKELNNILRIFGNQADLFFDQNNSFTPTATILLDQIVRILNKYTAMKLEIGVYPNNTNPIKDITNSSQAQAQRIVDFLVNKGVNKARLTGKGFSETRQAASDSPEFSRKLNLQVVFTVNK